MAPKVLVVKLMVMSTLDKCGLKGTMINERFLTSKWVAGFLTEMN